VGTFMSEFAVFSILCVALEAVYTGVGDQIRRYRSGEKIDLMLPCRSWLWSVPVYGISAAVSFTFIDAFVAGFYGLPWAVRGTVFVIGIYLWKLMWGIALELKLGKCPWQYVESPRLFRYIRPRHAPFWFTLGFALEWTHAQAVPALLVLHQFGP